MACRIRSSPHLTLARSLGAHYFLITLDQATGQRIQARYARLDVPNDDPCGHIDEVFGP